MLSDKDAQNLSELQSLRQQLTELVKETQRGEVEAMPAEDKMEVSRASWWRSGGGSCVVPVVVAGS